MASAVILGIDPGSRFTGYAGLQQRGRQLSVIRSGTIALKERDHMAARLGRLLGELDLLIDELKPDVMALEDIFTHRNARSALVLGQARGVALAAAGQRGLPVEAYPPASVKRAVTGNGRASKEQIQRMVRVLLTLQDAPGADEADAMAVGICHALGSRGRALVQAGTGGRRRSAR